jgi:hypothetical protein
MAKGDSGPPIGTDTTALGKCVPSAVDLTSSELSGLIRFVKEKSWRLTLPAPAPPVLPPIVVGLEMPHDQANIGLDPTSSMERVPAALSEAPEAGEATPRAAAITTPVTAARRRR